MSSPVLSPALALLLACGLALGCGSRSSAPSGDAGAAGVGALGHIDFPVSGTPACQRLFGDGMLALHSFEYERARETFEKALAADPGCAMAAWGAAMTHDHPLWSERDAPKARAYLARVTGEAALPPVERAYLATARALYAADDTREAHAAWLAAAAKMHQDFPGDDEIALQHALAILAAARPGDVRSAVAAGAVALDVFQRRPDHPGAAHYVIHAFDDPDHAVLALPAARAYARIAPSAGHALHMPSHTFTHLGLWADVVPANERAYAASVLWAKAHGETPGRYDWHSYSWLVAAHLELGHPARARALIDEARALMSAEKKDAADLRFNYAHMVTAYVTEADRWSDVEELIAPVLSATVDEAASPGAVACAMHAPGGSAELRPPFALYARLAAHDLRAMAAKRAGVRATLAKRLDDLQATLAQTQPWGKAVPERVAAYWAAERDVLAAPPSSPAEREALEKLVHVEEVGSYGPRWAPTGLEKLGDALRDGGQPREALARYERDLELCPKRAVALLRAARAAKAAGDAGVARERYRELAKLWETAEPDLPALAEVRAGAE
jgi:tetratricopeptide (TPR) repeat protein